MKYIPLLVGACLALNITIMIMNDYSPATVVFTAITACSFLYCVSAGR
jgi:hypothetical protein